MLKQTWQSLSRWSVPLATEEELANADVIVAHEYGDQRTVSRTTHAIAGNVSKLSIQHRKPTIVQFPVNVAIPDVPAIVISKHLRTPDAYLDTDEVQRQVAVICELRGWKKVILCAHWAHAWRAGKNLIHHGLIPIYADNSNVRFHLDSPRWEQKSTAVFMAREVAAKMLYFRKGLI